VKKIVISICIFTLLIVGTVSCVPTRSDRQLANIEAQLQNLTTALTSTQQELASTKQALAAAQEKTRLLEQQTRSTTTNYGVTTSYTASSPVTVPIAPTIVSFTASPTVMVAGQASNLQWNVTGADWVSITPGIGNVALTGIQAVYPISSTTYILTATNSAGSVTGYATITVSQPYTAPTYPYYSGYPYYPPSYFPPVQPRPPFPFPHHPFSGNHTGPRPPFPHP
jgi:hypothetical protein